MLRSLLKLSLGALAGSLGCLGLWPFSKPNPEVTNPTLPTFELYLLALSWKAEWCYHSPNPGCLKPEAWWADHLTMHGLWPDYGDGTYPTLCTEEPFDFDRLVAEVGMERLEQYWPNVQKSDGSKDYGDFWEHEWTKHGTCTGLTQSAYFDGALAMLEAMPTPTAIDQARGGHALRSDIEAALGGAASTILNCRGAYLSNIYLCKSVDPVTHLPGPAMDCPAAVTDHDDNCPANVMIASFG